MRIFIFMASVWLGLSASIAPRTAVLGNGLRVAVFENPSLPSVTVLTSYDVGTADDPLNMVGLSHMLEHMMFKGTAKFPKGEFDKAIASRGGWLNAYTNFDNTVYVISLPAESLELALEIEADRMKNLEITEKEFLPERKVVMEERLARMENHPLSTAVEAAQRMKYLAHPYGVMPIGFADHIKAYTVEALRDHYKTWYMPNNAEIAVVGPYSLERVLPMVEKHFGSIAAGTSPKRERVPEPSREGLTATMEQESKRLETIYLEVDYRAPTWIKRPEKLLAMFLLTDTLAGNDSRKPVKAIVKEKRLALAVSVNYDHGKDDMCFEIGLTLSPEMSIAEAENFLFEKLAEYARKGVSRQDFEDAKKEALNSLEFAMDGDAYLIDIAGKYLSGIPKEVFENYEKIIKDVTFEQINEALRSILANPPILITRLYPMGKMPKHPYRKPLAA